MFGMDVCSQNGENATKQSTVPTPDDIDCMIKGGLATGRAIMRFGIQIPINSHVVCACESMAAIDQLDKDYQEFLRERESCIAI